MAVRRVDAPWVGEEEATAAQAEEEMRAGHEIRAVLTRPREALRSSRRD